MKKPNAWGLFDMHGNTHEWCQDYYCSYEQEPETDPTGPLTGDCRVVRGGSRIERWNRCGSADRRLAPPEQAEAYIGFRVARDVGIAGHP